jgi:hypothetical protein
VPPGIFKIDKDWEKKLGCFIKPVLFFYCCCVKHPYLPKITILTDSQKKIIQLVERKPAADTLQRCSSAKRFSERAQARDVGAGCWCRRSGTSGSGRIRAGRSEQLCDHSEAEVTDKNF